ncbi:hypothetical protein Agub_g13633, partial [Astrephomene gubernaculifera]
MWLHRVCQFLYTTDYNLQYLACKAILEGPPPGQPGSGASPGDDSLDLISAFSDLATTHHPYEDAASRLQNIITFTVDSELRVLAGEALAILNSKRQDKCQPQLRCFCEGCNEVIRPDSCEVCRTCRVAVFCSPACRRASRLGRHASCYLDRISPAHPFPHDTAIYLTTLL